MSMTAVECLIAIGEHCKGKSCYRCIFNDEDGCIVNRMNGNIAKNAQEIVDRIEVRSGEERTCKKY